MYCNGRVENVSVNNYISIGGPRLVELAGKHQIILCAIHTIDHVGQQSFQHRRPHALECTATVYARHFRRSHVYISLWMKSSKLKLNSDKTKFIIIGTKQQRHKLCNHFPVKLLDNDISPSDGVRDLCVIFDSDFSFRKHVSNICKSCFYHIRELCRIRRHIPSSTAKSISNSLISSRLDYCNSLINNIAKQDLSKLQRVQNCLARVVLRAPRFSPSLPLP